jgi:hypothetical protein
MQAHDATHPKARQAKDDHRRRTGIFMLVDHGVK